MAEKEIQSPLLVGITKDHDDHSGAATMRATGKLIFHGDDPDDDAHDWFVEFKCDVCGQRVEAWYADLHDVIRQALKDAGIIKL